METKNEGDAPAAFDVRASARTLGDLAVTTLADIMKGNGSDAAKLGAAREVLDRAYGKARATEEGDGEPVTVVCRSGQDAASRTTHERGRLSTPFCTP